MIPSELEYREKRLLDTAIEFACHQIRMSEKTTNSSQLVILLQSLIVSIFNDRQNVLQRLFRSLVGVVRHVIRQGTVYQYQPSSILLHLPTTILR